MGGEQKVAFTKRDSLCRANSLSLTSDYVYVTCCRRDYLTTILTTVIVLLSIRGDQSKRGLGLGKGGEWKSHSGISGSRVSACVVPRAVRGVGQRCGEQLLRTLGRRFRFGRGERVRVKPCRSAASPQIVEPNNRK